MENIEQLLQEIHEQKAIMNMERLNLDGLRMYENHLMQGIQTNRFNIKESEENILQHQNNINYLVEQITESLQKQP